MESRRQGTTHRPACPGDVVPVAGMQSPVLVTGRGFCRKGLIGCRRPILWARTASERKIPLDPDPDESGVYTPHRTTCPHAGKFRGGGSCG